MSNSNEQQPHLDILSHNRVNRSKITFVGSIVAIIFALFAVYCLLPYHYWIGLVLVIFGGYILLCIMAWCFLFLRRKWYESHIIPASEHGAINMATWQHLPALPAPQITVSEVKEEESVDRVKQALDILEIHSHGTGYKSISKGYQENGDNYWSEWRVRQLCESHKNRQK